MDKTVQFLQNTEVFRGLSENQLQDVKNSFKKVSLKKEEPIVYLGDESDSVFLIKEGLCKVFIPFDFGMGENILSYLKKGELFGEMGVITGKKRVANTTCFTDVELLVMSGPDFWKAANQYPAILKNIIFILSDRLNAQNLRTGARRRASLNLNVSQKEALDNFFSFIEEQNQTWVSRIMNTEVPIRNFRWTPLLPLKRCANVVLRFLIKLATKPYISKIEGLENIPTEKPVIFLLGFRTIFDFLFLYKVYDHLGSHKALSFALRVDGMGKILFFFLRGLFSVLNVSYLTRHSTDRAEGAEDAVNLLNRMHAKGKMVDVALYPFSEKSMRYDRAMGYHHIVIWLMTGEERDIIPVAILGTDKFWPFEPWNRKFFDISAFLNLKSVKIKIGEKISLKDMGFKEKLDKCEGNQENVKRLFDKTNNAIGSRLAALQGQQYTPIYQGAEQELLRSFNEKWSNRLSLMLPAGLGLRKKYRKSSVKVRHFTWHAEMLNVLLEHLGDHSLWGPVMPTWSGRFSPWTILTIPIQKKA
ncbi:MAG: cyclic nucleotide-binding domain-containing protein [Deltaproteobacteria bacterium]|nr:cyclic nucleotide-binding domain-containing protein [Deltaproteobacteria bacterium]